MLITPHRRPAEKSSPSLAISLWQYLSTLDVVYLILSSTALAVAPPSMTPLFLLLALLLSHKTRSAAYQMARTAIQLFISILGHGDDRAPVSMTHIGSGTTCADGVASMPCSPKPEEAAAATGSTRSALTASWDNTLRMWTFGWQALYATWGFAWSACMWMLSLTVDLLQGLAIRAWSSAGWAADTTPSTLQRAYATWWHVSEMAFDLVVVAWRMAMRLMHALVASSKAFFGVILSHTLIPRAQEVQRDTAGIGISQLVRLMEVSPGSRLESAELHGEVQVEAMRSPQTVCDDAAGREQASATSAAVSSAVYDIAAIQAEAVRAAIGVILAQTLDVGVRTAVVGLAPPPAACDVERQCCLSL